MQYSRCLDEIKPEGNCTGELADFSKNILKVRQAGLPECGVLQQNVFYAQFNEELQCEGRQSGGGLKNGKNGALTTMIFFVVTLLS